MSPSHRNLAAAALASLAVLVGAYGLTPGVVVDVGEMDSTVFRGFTEPFASGPRWLRQSRASGASRIVLRQIGKSRESRLELRVWTSKKKPPVPLRVVGAGQRLLDTLVQGRQTLSVPLLGDVLDGGDLQIKLGSPQSTGAQRRFGPAVEGVTWTPRGWTFPPTRQLWVVPGFALLLGLLLLRLGRSETVAGSAAAVAGAALALGAGLRPLQVAPYTHRLLLMLALSHLALTLWALLTSARGGGWLLPGTADAEDLLVLMGVGYWMFFLFQLALCREAAPRICPRTAKLILGSLVVAGLLALLLPPLRRLRGLPLRFLAVGGVAELIVAVADGIRRRGVDFMILWRAAHEFRLGQPLYRLDEVVANSFDIFKVPPFYGMLLLPYGGLDPDTALALHRSLGVLLYLAVGALLVALLRGALGGPAAAAAVVMILGLMQPSVDTLAYGQIDVVLLALLALAFVGVRTGRSWLAGSALALATLFKLYPLLMVGYLVARREWRAIAWTGAALLALNGLAIGVMGWDTHVIYATQVLPHMTGGTNWIENQSLNGFVSRLLTRSLRIPLFHDPVIDAVTYAGFVLAAGTSLLLASKPSDRRSTLCALQFGLWVVVLVLAVTAAWMHYQTLTLLAFAFLVWHVAEQPCSASQALLVALAFDLVAYGNQWSFFDGRRAPGLPTLGLSYKFYGLALVWGILARRIQRAGAVTPR